MKILLVGPASPYRGGIANFNDSLYAALDISHDPHIINYSLQYPSILFPGRSQYERGAPHTRSRSRKLINSVNPFTWARSAGEIASMLPDLIVVHYWMPFFAPALGRIIRAVKRKIDVPVAGLLHNIEPHEGMPAGKRLNRYFLRSCDGFITMSSTVLNDLEKTGVKKPVVQVPHPVYDIFGEPVTRQFACDNLGLEPDSRHLLFFGIIRSYKGLDLLLETLVNRRLAHLDLKLLVAGEFYEDEGRYLDMVEKLGLEKRIMFTNSFVPKEEVAWYFAAADLVVLPYHSATQSGVTQIAYNFDKPMLVTNVGGLRDVVKHGRVGYVCEKDPDEIAAAIADFFDNNRAGEFISNIRKDKLNYSWASLAGGIEDLYSVIRKEQDVT